MQWSRFGALASTSPGDLRVSSAVSRPSFDEIYDRHFAFVWRVLRSLGVPDALVEDAAQDVFLIVHRKLDHFSHRASIRTWLFAIAARIASNYRRSVRRKAHVEPLGEDAEVLEDTRPSPLATVEQQEALRLLETALDALDERKRIAFVLSEIEGMSVPEIAELLELNVRTTYSRVHFAREEFAKALARAKQRQR